MVWTMPHVTRTGQLVTAADMNPTASAQLIPVGECVECKQMVIVASGKGHAPTCRYRPAQRTLLRPDQVRAVQDENGHVHIVDVDPEPVAPKPDRMFRKIDLEDE